MLSLPAPAALEWMERQGVRNPHHNTPEFNSRVWRAHSHLEATFLGGVAPATVWIYEPSIAFTNDPYDPSRSGLNWAFANPVLHPLVPCTAAQWLGSARGCCQALQEANLQVLTDTFAFSGPAPRMPAPHLVDVVSPVAEGRHTDAEWLASLSPKRRKNIRRLDRAAEACELRLELCHKPLSESELWSTHQALLERWGVHDLPYAFAQTLWTQAVASILPETALFLRAFIEDRLVFIQTMLRRQTLAECGAGIYAQSMVALEPRAFDGLGTFVDAWMARRLAQVGAQYLDTGCRATWDDPESIGVAKRATVNADRVRQILAIGGRLPASIQEALNNDVPLGRSARVQQETQA